MPDRRKGPRTDQHRHRISVGLRRASWGHRQSKLAEKGLPHVIVPMTAAVASSFNEPRSHTRKYGVTAIAGACHWCHFWGKAGTRHLPDSDDPMPTEENVIIEIGDAPVQYRQVP